MSSVRRPGRAFIGTFPERELTDLAGGQIDHLDVVAGLDPRARRTLINLLRELPITMLVSTHDMKLVEELFPRTIVMDEGVIVADGMTKEILADAKLLEAHGLEKP